MREKKEVRIERFDNFDKNINHILTKTFYNFKPSSQLENSKGIANAKFPKNPTNKTAKELNISASGITSIEGISYFKQYHPTNKLISHRLLIYGNDKKVYINQMLDDTWELFWLYNLEFENAPIIMNFKKDDVDAVILASDDMMKIWQTGYSPYTISEVPIISSMCMNESVLFCTIKEPAHKIWYATDLDPENVGNISKNSGYVSLEDNLGDAKKVITFNEDVYVFRDYGISKITQYYGTYTANQVYQSNTKIYANTVSVCGNNILFMTKEGLYSFNGVKVNKTSIELLNSLSVDNNGAVASSLGEKYYLALHMDFQDDKTILCENECVNNVIIVIDTSDFTYEIIRGVDVKSMLPVKTEVFEKMLVTFNNGPVNKIGEIVDSSIFIDEPLPKFWSCGSVVDSMNTKLFTKLSVDADKGVKFSILSDGKVTSFTTYQSGINEFVFKICCKDLKLEISSPNESSVVKTVILDYYEY